MTTYRSKIDHWLWIAIVLVILGSLIVSLLKEQAIDLKLLLVMCVQLIIPTFFVVNIFTNTFYTIDEKKQILRVKSGVFVDSKYDINKITSVRETHTWLSSPALSLDRLEIKIGEKRKVIISPNNKTEFINHLLKLNPKIMVE